MTSYHEQLAELTIADPALSSQLEHLTNLRSVLTWAPTVGISLKDIDLLQQDEYSHDVSLPLPNGCWLVFGVT